jgi:hypothetical protein
MFGGPAIKLGAGTLEVGTLDVDAATAGSMTDGSMTDGAREGGNSGSVPTIKDSIGLEASVGEGASAMRWGTVAGKLVGRGDGLETIGSSIASTMASDSDFERG